MTQVIGTAYVPQQNESHPISNPWGGGVRSRVTKFADARSLDIGLGDLVTKADSRPAAVAAAKQFVASDIDAHALGDNAVDWAKTHGAIVMAKGDGTFDVHRATGPLGTPTWGQVNGVREPGFIQFAHRFHSRDAAVTDVVNGYGELTRLRMTPGMSNGLRIAGAVAALGGVAAAGIGLHLLSRD